MQLKFDKTIYPKEAIIKTAYTFLGDYSLQIEHDESCYYVDIEFNKETPSESRKKKLKTDFSNELLMNTIRYIVSQKTRTIREIIITRALASTIIDNNNVNDKSITNEKDDIGEDFDIDSILTDWFAGGES